MDDMNQTASNSPTTDTPGIDTPISTQVINPQSLELRDIHLPEPISWWPIAPGWWLLLALILALIAFAFFARKRYLKRQLNRDIKAEIEDIKQQYARTQNQPQLALSLIHISEPTRH